MPITTSAKKALRQDRKRTVINNRLRTKVKTVLKAYLAQPTGEQLVEVYSMVDKAAKKNLMHPNKAARLKSRASALLKKEAASDQKPGKPAKAKAAKAPKKTKKTE
jgi:small subunit ribosomal protein S20